MFLSLVPITGNNDISRRYCSFAKSQEEPGSAHAAEVLSRCQSHLTYAPNESTLSKTWSVDFFQLRKDMSNGVYHTL